MDDSRPVIAVPSALEPARYGVWEAVCALLQMGYIRAVQRGGAMCLMIPPDPELEENPDEILDRVDGLMLAGGADIDPSAYGEPSHPETLGTAPERDRLELALVRGALERDMPVLGICRGMQLMNVALGGTLHQHLPDLVGHGDHRRNPGSFDGSEHDVRLEPGSLAARVIGEELHSTKSHHHQAVDRLGDGLVISGRSVLDDLPEALEAPENTFALGVQWHPEADPTSPVVSALVDEVRTRRLARR